eukprot:COSAG01_NODE_9957_length_2292_cov_7.086183_3_plen_71_part_01
MSSLLLSETEDEIRGAGRAGPPSLGRPLRAATFVFLQFVSCSQPHILDVPPQFVQLLDLFSSCVLAVFVGH